MRPLYILIIIGFLCAFKANDKSIDANTQQKLALSKKYLELTHRDERVEEIYRRELKIAWSRCEDRQCQAKLDHAISKAVTESAPEYESAYARLIASRLTVAELRAAISFVQSPQGKAMVNAEIAMDDDLAQIGHAFSKHAHDAVQKDFCSSEPKACVQIGRTSLTKLSRP